MPHFVEIQVPGLPSQEHELQGLRMIVGTGPEADIRLRESSGLSGRHLELGVQEQGVLVQRAQQARAALVFRGQECGEAFVPWGEEVYIGGVRLGFITRARKSTSPLLLLAPALLLALGLTVVPRLAIESESSAEVDAPPLALAQIACRERDPAHAEQRARDAEHAARAKMQRSAFVAREGVEALDLFHEARACFSDAGRASEAERAAIDLERWASRLNDDYTTARLRLRVALDQKRHRDALQALKSLQALLSARPSSPYSEWLSVLQRQLERRVAKSGP